MAGTRARHHLQSLYANTTGAAKHGAAKHASKSITRQKHSLQKWAPKSEAKQFWPSHPQDLQLLLCEGHANPIRSRPVESLQPSHPRLIVISRYEIYSALPNDVHFKRSRQRGRGSNAHISQPVLLVTLFFKPRCLQPMSPAHSVRSAARKLLIPSIPEPEPPLSKPHLTSPVYATCNHKPQKMRTPGNL